jgi:pimeloyl-ACP methyl ester carboxylesterase
VTNARRLRLLSLIVACLALPGRPLSPSDAPCVDLLDLPFPTLGGKQFWKDRLVERAWRIQENIFTGHCRLLDPGDVRQTWGSFAKCERRLTRERAANAVAFEHEHLVVLLHGLGRAKESFSSMAAALREDGYAVAAINYPSLRGSVAQHATQVAEIIERSRTTRRVSFVTHSLGALVVRELLGREEPWRARIEIGRVVMLAPPNQGSAIADALHDWRLYRFLMGDSGQNLTSRCATKLPTPDCEFGVIAGGRGDSSGGLCGTRGYNPLLVGDNDGLVRVEATRLDGMRDFLIVPSIHTIILSDDETIRATLTFLKRGRFGSRPSNDESRAR